MANGMKSFIERETPETLENDCVDEFISYCKDNDIHPTPRQVNKMLLPEMRNRISTRNNTADKTDQWSKPARLAPQHIAKCMLAFENIIKLSMTEKGSIRPKDAALAIYCDKGPFKGTYTFDMDVITAKINEYSSALKGNEIDALLSYLNSNAPLRRRTLDENLIAVQNGIFD